MTYPDKTRGSNAAETGDTYADMDAPIKTRSALIGTPGQYNVQITSSDWFE